MTLGIGQRPFEILLVEDNLGDITLMKEILKMSKFPIHLNTVRNGSDALNYLYHEGNFQDSREPDVILLDLNLPKVDGREVLAQIKADSLLGHIPILVMTSSKNEADVLQAYKNKANFYIVKPMDMDHYMVIMKYLDDFWIRGLKGHRNNP
jgi:two-component system, chemotaxis family, response regulator Rcp1